MNCVDYWLDQETWTVRGDFEGMYQNISDPWGCEAGKSSLNNRLFLEMLVEQAPYRRALDVGCGLGGLTSSLTRFSVEVTGCDVSETAVRKAQQSYPGINFVCRDIKSDPFSGAYDLITMAEVLWFMLEKLDYVLDTVNELLSPTGVFAVHQYFPADQRLGKDVVDGESHYVAILQSRFREINRVSCAVKDGTVLLGTFGAW